jgi:hypothetical protein
MQQNHLGIECTHSVRRSPGQTAWTRAFGPWVLARHLAKCMPILSVNKSHLERNSLMGVHILADLATEYAMLLPVEPKP